MHRPAFVSLTLASFAALAAGAITMLAPASAEACGGTFCDGQVPGPQQMPVDQTGESIVFVMDEGSVEAHIQIQYEGDPERFGWIVPVQSEPDVEVGSQTFFDNLLAATVPTFTLDTQNANCNGSTASFSMCAFAGARDEGSALGGDGGGTGQGTGNEGEDDDGNPEIIKRGFAGAFQFDVLQGGTVDGVVAWLDQAGYTQDPDAPPILQEYLDEDFMFVAIKLRSGAGVDEIHPLVLRYEGMEPCVPIRLTRIAAVPHMAIRSFFLADDRVVPQNYQHVELNALKFNWLGIASGAGTLYNDRVIQAIDEADDGHAFVTEYAGTSNVVSQANLRDPDWDAEPFVDAEAIDVIGILSSQGLIDCASGECSYPHPMVPALLADYLPVPDGVNEDDFYSELLSYEELIDLDAWNGSGFAMAMEERIIVPGEHAIDILTEHDYLSRLFTTISPEEMTVDPLFWQNPDLEDVSNQYFATRWNSCEGPDWIELDDGRIIALDDNFNQPDFDDQPFAAKVQTITQAGAPMDVEDSEEAIEDSLDDWNESRREVLTGGCGCRSVGISPEGIVFFGAVFGFAFSQRRRRR